MMRKHTFNLIEILMALGVLMIGVVSLIGLFPLASKVTTDATMHTYVPNATEDMCALIRELANRDKATGKPLGWEVWVTGSGDYKLPTSSDLQKEKYNVLKEDSKSKSIAEVLSDDSAWTSVDEFKNPYLFKHNTLEGIYQLLTVRGYPGNKFVMKDNEVYVEGRTLITVWQEPLVRDFVSNVPQTYPNTKGIKVNVKVEWPAERPETEIVDGEKVYLRETKVLSFNLLKNDFVDSSNVNRQTNPSTTP